MYMFFLRAAITRQRLVCSGCQATIALLFLVLAGATLASTAEPPVQPVISALEKGGVPVVHPGTPPPYLDVLEQHGILVSFPNEGMESRPLTWELLRRYNLLILPSSPNLDSIHSAARSEPVNDLLDRYLRAGGGILCFCPPLSAMKSEHDDLNAWLQPYGAELEWATIDDDAHIFRNPPPVPWQAQSYLWTANVAASPITAGVKALFFRNETFRSPSVRPLKVSGDWQVLLSTEATSVAVTMTDPIGAETAVQKKAGSERRGAQPIVAVRDIGKGRLAVVAASSAPFYFDLGKLVGGEVVTRVGDGQRTSDWLPLLRNLCVWLSEPARAAGLPGGAKGRAAFKVNPQYGSRDPIDWELPGIAIPDSEVNRLCTQHCGPWTAEDWRAMAGGRHPSFKFLVGAHSGRSGGKGSVADWKLAAQAAGFDGVVFRETILNLTREQWDAFEAECKAASNDTFYAVPGWDWTDWEGNRFLMFNQHLPYFKAERLTKDRRFVRDQEMFYFDAGWPANMPIFVKKNPEAYWNYRLYNSIPVNVYQGGRKIEDNRDEWVSLVNRIEDPAPMSVYLLEDPAEVAAAVPGQHLMLIAPTLRDIQENPRWQQLSFGLGINNTVVASISDGPVIQAFEALNMYRTTLGSRGVPGSYRYQVLLRVKSAEPLALVELWGGGQCLRRYRPNATEFATVIDEQHDRQRGLWLRVVDRKGREALAGKLVAHDKRMIFTWCGDHCNSLPWGQGLDAQGNPVGIGIVTHPKSIFRPFGGPGASANEAAMYVAYGTDTSAPSLEIFGETTLHTPGGPIPADFMHLVPDVKFWYGNRDTLITRQPVDRWADKNRYTPENYGYAYISGWGPYFHTEPTPDFDVLTDDIDFHHDAGKPAFQLCRGELRFKRRVELKETPTINVVFGQLGWKSIQKGTFTAAGPLAQPGNFAAKLGRGNYFTWPGDWGHGTLFALDDQFAASAVIDAKGATQGTRPAFGYALGARTFNPGDVLKYRFLILRWPVGSTMADRLDTKIQTALNLKTPDSGVRLDATQGRVLDTQFIMDLAADQGVFRGRLQKLDLGFRLPVRVSGLNENWTAGLWRQGLAMLVPEAVDPDGLAWLTVDPAADAGEILIGNLITCENPAVILRLFQQQDGGWLVIAHNPTAKSARITVRGTAGGPVPALKHKVKLEPGEEVRWVHRN